MADNPKFVRWLQKRFNTMGLSLKVDGKAGEDTRAALLAFQRAMGLPETGVSDKATVLAVKNFKPASLSPTGTTADQTQPGMVASGAIPLTPPPEAAPLPEMANGPPPPDYSTANSPLAGTDSYMPGAPDFSEADPGMDANKAGIGGLRDYLGTTQSMGDLARILGGGQQGNPGPSPLPPPALPPDFSQADAGATDPRLAALIQALVGRGMQPSPSDPRAAMLARALAQQ